jgi:NitT/TauT family transport system permease protein
MLFRIARVVLFYVALVAIWQAVVMLEIWPKYLVPPPADVWESLKDNIENNQLPEAVQLTMRRLLIGYSMSLVIGMSLGMAVGTWKWVEETIGSLIVGLQSLPSITWAPLAVLWFGLNDKAIIFVVLMGSISAIAISTSSGVRNIPPLYRKAALTMGANRLQMTRYVLLPAMLPALAPGLKLGWSFAWRSLLAAELVIVTGLSIGRLLETGRDLTDMSLVVAVMTVIVVIGLLADFLVFGRLERWTQERWGYATA